MSRRIGFWRFWRCNSAQFGVTWQTEGGERHRMAVLPSYCHGFDRVRVLVLEDQDAVRQAIVAMLDREPGFVVAQASSLAEARGMLEDVDVAVLDLHLPDGSGAALIPELRAVNPDACAVVLTSSIEATETAHALESGAAAVLNKLEDLDQVIPTIRRLHGRGSR